MPQAHPEQLNTDINKIIEGSFGTASAALAGALAATQGGLNNDGQQIS